MTTEDTIIKLLLQKYLKPLIKDVITEILVERNTLTLKQNDEALNSLVDSNEAIKLLGGINRHTLYNLIKMGLPAMRLGKSYKFRREDINKFIATRSETAKKRHQNASL